jgi:hypothetical protein
MSWFIFLTWNGVCVQTSVTVDVGLTVLNIQAVVAVCKNRQCHWLLRYFLIILKPVLLSLRTNGRTCFKHAVSCCWRRLGGLGLRGRKLEFCGQNVAAGVCLGVEKTRRDFGLNTWTCFGDGTWDTPAFYHCPTIALLRVPCSYLPWLVVSHSLPKNSLCLNKISIVLQTQIRSGSPKYLKPISPFSSSSNSLIIRLHTAIYLWFRYRIKFQLDGYST